MKSPKNNQGPMLELQRARSGFYTDRKDRLMSQDSTTLMELVEGISEINS